MTKLGERPSVFEDPELGLVKLCPNCPEGDNVWPATSEFFHRNGTRLQSWCRACTAEYNATRRPRRAR